MLDRQWAESQLPLVLLMLQGTPVSFVERTGNEAIEQPFAVDPSTMQRYEWRNGANPNIPFGSVGVIPITGPITKYNGDCGEPGAIARNNWLMQMERRQNISSMVLLMDTPGGEARAAHSSVALIKKSSKPVLSFVDGMSASLGVWFTSASDEVWFSSKNDQLGSIGSYCTLMDVRGYFEKQGIKLHEIYAPQSEDKNKEYREALKGNYELIEQDLKRHVEDFISFVSKERSRAAATQKEWSSGKMFYAEEAIKLGLGDRIGDFAQVISKAAWLSKRKHNHI